MGRFSKSIEIKHFIATAVRLIFSLFFTRNRKQVLLQDYKWYGKTLMFYLIVRVLE